MSEASGREGERGVCVRCGGTEGAPPEGSSTNRQLQGHCRYVTRLNIHRGTEAVCFTMFRNKGFALDLDEFVELLDAG